MVPPRFHEFNPGKLPPGSQAPFRTGLANWRMTDRGMIIDGPSGSGKTRAMWEVLKNNLDADTKIFVPGPNSFGNSLMKAYRQEVAEIFIENISEARLVVIDDVTKLKMTERLETELFGIIDYRYSHGKPMIVTVQGLLSDYTSDDKGGALVRRLQEFNDHVTLYGSIIQKVA